MMINILTRNKAGRRTPYFFYTIDPIHICTVADISRTPCFRNYIFCLILEKITINVINGHLA